MKFDYLKASTIEEALELKEKYKEGGFFLAGGTDLMIKIRRKSLKPKVLINIKNIKDLGRIEEFDEYLSLGPLVTLSEIAKNPLIRERFPVLSETALLMASPQVRNLGTVGGNLANAAPSADLAPPLIALDSEVLVVSKSGEEKIKLEDFFLGPGETILGDEKLMKSILIPKPKNGFRIVYRRHTLREAMDIAIISAAVGLLFNGGRIDSSRIVIGAVAPVPLRVTSAEDILDGTDGNEDIIERAAEESSMKASPITDVRGTLEYRRAMIKVFIRRILKELIA